MTLPSTDAQTRRRLASGLLAVLLSTAVPAFARELPEEYRSEIEQEEALFIGNINGDGIADTLFGSITTGSQYRPTGISWGLLPTPGGRRIVRSLRQTRFFYPDWATAGGSVSVSDMNADSMADLIVYIWGESTERDRKISRSRSYLLFGAAHADTVEQIDLGGSNGRIPGALHPHPITRGGLLVDRAVRDHTGIASYLRLPLELHTDEKPDPPAPPRPALSPQVRLYPNPAGSSVEIAATGLAAGPCTITTVDLDGRQLHSRQGVARSDGKLGITLDLESLPSGYYIVTIDDAEKIVRSLPLLVVH